MSNREYHRATGAVAIASTLAPGVVWQLESIRLHLSAAGGSGTFTVQIDHGTGAPYDLALITQDMTAISDFTYTPEFPMTFDAATEMDFAWANANGRTYGLEVVWQPIRHLG